jgi:lambda family phage portal protein
MARAASVRAPTPARSRSRQLPAVRASSTTSVYEAASQTRRTLGWRAPTTTPNAAILYNLTTLRDRSRAAVRNDGFAKGIIDRLVSNIVGTGITLRSKADDPAFRKSADTLWLRWCDYADADGQFDWFGLQTLAVRAWLESGETFVRLRPRLPSDNLPVPLQLQVIEPELCPHNYISIANGQYVRAGIEFNGIGRRTAYYLYRSRPELDDYDASQLLRVPADSVVHLYNPLRPGQLRGLPHLTQALIRLYELDKFDDATLLRVQLANLFVGFVKHPASGDTEALHPVTGLPIEKDGDNPLLSLEPGIFQELGPGEDVTFSDPPEVKSGYRDFMRQQLFNACAATNVPYEVLTGDMTGLNDRVMRVILHEFRRGIMAMQHQVVGYQLCRRVWQAWMDRAFLFGALPIPAEYATNPEPWARVDWTPHGWPYLHPVQDVEAQRAAIRAGFTTRSAVVAEQGEDSESVDTEQKIDNDRADGLGLPYESDPRQRVGGAGSAAAAPASA